MRTATLNNGWRKDHTAAGSKWVDWGGFLKKAAMYGSALALFCGGVSETNAATIAWTANQPVTYDSTIYFNVFDGTVSTEDFSGYTFRIEAESNSQLILGNNVNGLSNRVRNSIMYAANVPYESTVDANGGYWSNAFVTQVYEGTFYTEFVGGVTGYLGLEFRDQNENVYYGWASIVREPESLLFTLTGFGYNDVPGEGATVGAIPEPTVAGLMALSGVMLALRRRWRAKAA